MIKTFFERIVLDRDTPKENIALVDTWASQLVDKLNYFIKQAQQEFAADKNKTQNGIQSLRDDLDAAKKDASKSITSLRDDLTADVSQKHHIASITVNHSAAWTTRAVNGSTMYTLGISVSSVYVDVPTVSLGGSNGIPTAAEQAAYSLLQFVTIDADTKTLKLYANARPSSDFVINVEGIAI